MVDKENFAKDINVPRKEPIMIDGVDVNRCIDFNKRDKVSCYHILYDKCNECPNCYFKQLARKTQECEEYEQALDEIAAHYQKVIKNITNYDDSYDASISIKALHNISDIINKVKGDK